MLNYSFSCSFSMSGTEYVYANDTYGLGFVPCGVNYTVYGSTLREILYNKAVTRANISAPSNTTASP